MARIAGVELLESKRVWVALLGVYGIGPVTAKKIINALKIENEKLKHDLEIFKVKVHYECTNGDSLISTHLN